MEQGADECEEGNLVQGEEGEQGNLKEQIKSDGTCACSITSSNTLRNAMSILLWSGAVHPCSIFVRGRDVAGKPV